MKIKERKDKFNSPVKESDRSGGPVGIFEFEIELERIMESFVSKKIKMVKEIKRKYTELINEIKENKHEVFKQLVLELKRRME